MKDYKVLILTDHANHSSENALYPLAKAMLNHRFTQCVDIASRAVLENAPFFNNLSSDNLWVSEVGDSFQYQKDGFYLKSNLKNTSISNYDLIWLRMPPPLDWSFLNFLEKGIKNQIIINQPKGIFETGTKAFLINFPEICAPMMICKTKEDVVEFKESFPIVLKPFREYGGRGIYKIDKNKVWNKNEEMNFDSFIEKLDDGYLPCLAVKYLKNVTKGDKRIIVVNGKILGASLRLPAQNSWLCNVAMGGKSVHTKVDEDEINIIKKIDPILNDMGIVMYGVDTLVNDEGKRVLSEINTTSIGGLPQIAKQQNLPLVEEAIDLIWKYFLEKKNNNA